MVFLYVAFVFLALWGFHIRRPLKFSDGLTVEQSRMIKGFFVLLVFSSHLSQYLELPGGILSESFWFIRSNLGQLIVVPFLFFSGYGVRCSIMRKGDAYLRSFPQKRILRTYLHTAVILLVFLSMQLILGRRYSFGRILLGLSLLGSFGNSNWYLFAILCLYAFTWLSFQLAKTQKQACLLCFLFTAVYYIVLSHWKESWWYDTVFVYTFGLLFPDMKSFFEKLTDRMLGWTVIFAGLAAVFLTLTKLNIYGIDEIKENVRAIAFMLMILVFLSRFQFGNPVLGWLGDHVFLCYLLQRLPMILLDYFDVSKNCITLFLGGSAVLTVLLVLVFDRVLKYVDRRLFLA